MKGASFAVVAVLAATATPSLAAGDPLVSVPFVGCPSDGQLGPQPPPSRPGEDRQAVAPRSVAKKLALYASDKVSVLAPRGWRCFGAFGSNGAALTVAPHRLALNQKLAGPAVELSFSDAGTSGRFAVADAIAAYFPTQKAFLTGQMAKGLLKPDQVQAKGSRTDRVRRVSAVEVRFRTPGWSAGAGTQGYLVPSADPIYGFTKLIGDPARTRDGGLVVLRMRLPSGAAATAPAIVASAEALKP